MWKVLHASTVGTSHTSTHTPCQDVCDFRRVTIGGDEFLLVAICDGAGSAACAEEGANATVESWLNVATVELNLSTSLDEETMIAIAESCHNDLACRAKNTGRKINDFACTLLTSVIGPKFSIFFQVGDGVWVRGSKEHSEPITWPFQGEYAGEVVFITSSNRKEYYQAHVIDTPESVAGTTDGLERLAIDFSTKTATNGFFQPMWSALRNGEPEALKSGLQAFLSSERVNNRTDDDKTLFLATRNAGLR